jgi:Uncharacterized conserved protein (DUF2190)
MSFSENILTRSHVTSAAIAQYKFCTITSGLAVTAASAGVRIDGVSITDAASGKAVSLAYLGRVPVTAAGTIALGALVTTNASGNALTATTGQIIAGIAMEAAVSGQVFTIDLRLDGTAAP